MNRSKPIIAGLFFLLILFLLIRLFFPIKLSPFQAIPNTTPVLIAWENITVPLSENEFGLRLPAEEIDLLRSINEGELALSTSIPVIQTLQLTGEEGMKSTFILELSKSKLTEKEWFEHFNWIRKGETIFRGERIITFERLNGQRHTACKYKKLLLIGFYSFQVEEALAQLKLKDQSIYSDQAFRKVLKNKKISSPYSVFLQLNYLGTWMEKWFSIELLTEITQLTQNSNWLRINATPDKQAHFDGQLLGETRLNTRKQDNTYLKSLSQVLPANTHCFFQFEQNQDLPFSTTKNPSIPSWYEKYIQAWANGSIAFVQMEATGDQRLSNRFLVLEFKEEKALEAGLRGLLEESGELDGFTYQAYEVKRLVEENLLEPILGESTWIMKNPYFVILNNYVVFGKERAAMELWIDQFIVGETLDKIPVFSNEVLSERQSIQSYSYFNSRLLKDKLLSNDHLPFFLKPVLAHENHLLLGMDRKGNFKALNFLAEEKAKTVSILWRTPIDSEVQRGPQAIQVGTNSYFLVQDLNNNLILLDINGVVQWKRRLTSGVISDFKLIDLEGKGEQQILFNTKAEIYVLNLKGEIVEGFPIQMESDISNGVLAVDFDGIHDYSFFIACENGNVYGLDEEGRPISGWNPLNGFSKVSQTILHYQEKEKDNLIILDDAGILSVQKGDASLRFPPLDFGQVFKGPLSLMKFGEEVRIVLLGEDGKIYWIDLDGSFTASSLGTNLSDFQVDVQTTNTFNNILLLEGTKLVYSSIEKNKLVQQWDKNLDGTGWSAYQLTEVSGQNYIGLVHPEKNQIRLLDQEGQEDPAFPLAGNTSFEFIDWPPGKKKLLVVGSQNSIIAYRVAPFNLDSSQ